jgi:predicted molibdopterin-dependent oxidoreductase YjgC
MFERYAPSSGHTVTIFVDERELQVEPGLSVAAALLASGYASTRHTPVTGSPRGPWCLMGTCFDCLVAVDGVPDTQACATTVREGMRISLPAPASGGRSETEVDPWSAGP